MSLSAFERRSALWLALAAVALGGCSREPQLVLLPVEGRVSLDGKPLTNGVVSLRPDSNSDNWHQPTGRIDENGIYTVFTDGRPGAPEGEYRVVVFSTETPASGPKGAHPGLPKSVIPVRYNDPDKSKLRVKVAPDAPADQFQLKLTSHAR